MSDFQRLTPLYYLKALEFTVWPFLWHFVSCVNSNWFQIYAVGQGVSRCEESDTLKGLQHDSPLFQVKKDTFSDSGLNYHILPRWLNLFYSPYNGLAHDQACSDTAQREGSLLCCPWLSLFRGMQDWELQEQRAPKALFLLLHSHIPVLSVRRGKTEQFCSSTSPVNNCLQRDLRTCKNEKGFSFILTFTENRIKLLWELDSSCLHIIMYRLPNYKSDP